MIACPSKLTIEFIVGTEINDAKQFATELAVKYNCEVEFAFNDMKFSGGWVFENIPRLVFKDMEEIKEYNPL